MSITMAFEWSLWCVFVLESLFMCVFVFQKKKKKKGSINNYHNYEISYLDKKIKEEKKSWSI